MSNLSIYPLITLKPGREAPVKAGHPWIFSNAIFQPPVLISGSLVCVQSAANELLGIGFWNAVSAIHVRMIDLNAKAVISVAYFTCRIQQCNQRKLNDLSAQTTVYRVVHSEGDGLPGLIVDRYGEVLVFQIHTAGMDVLRPLIIDALKIVFSPVAIVERSDVSIRQEEGLVDFPKEVRFGVVDPLIECMELGRRFYVDVVNGQKTGFFIDQRDARGMVGQLAINRHVLNLFCYTGGFSVYAAKAGALSVTSIDGSRPALDLVQRNFSLNALPENHENYPLIQGDVFSLLSTNQLRSFPYDLIICDPPAFAKSHLAVKKALSAYETLNAACLRLLQPGGLLVTSSCSGRISMADFKNSLRLAAGRAGRRAVVRQELGQPLDHTETIAFPEGRYLKTVVLEVLGVGN